MNAKFVIAGFLVMNFIVLFCLAHRYEFHLGADGRIIWRCNNFTGKAEHSSAGGKWIAIPSTSSSVSSQTKLLEDYAAVTNK